MAEVVSPNSSHVEGLAVGTKGTKNLEGRISKKKPEAPRWNEQNPLPIWKNVGSAVFIVQGNCKPLKRLGQGNRGSSKRGLGFRSGNKPSPT